MLLQNILKTIQEFPKIFIMYVDYVYCIDIHFSKTKVFVPLKKLLSIRYIKLFCPYIYYLLELVIDLLNFCCFRVWPDIRKQTRRSYERHLPSTRVCESSRTLASVHLHFLSWSWPACRDCFYFVCPQRDTTWVRNNTKLSNYLTGLNMYKVQLGGFCIFDHQTVHVMLYFPSLEKIGHW